MDKVSTIGNEIISLRDILHQYVLTEGYRTCTITTFDIKSKSLNT